MYTVTQEIIDREPFYRVINKETGEVKGKFDSDRNAMDFANYLNRGQKNDKSERHN